MARYDFIPGGYKVHNDYLVNIETGKVWNTDKTIEELEAEKNAPAEQVTETVAEQGTEQPVTIPTVSAKKVTKKINKG